MFYYLIVDKKDGHYVAINNQLCIYADEEIAKSVLASYQAIFSRGDKTCDYEVKRVRIVEPAKRVNNLKKYKHIS